MREFTPSDVWRKLASNKGGTGVCLDDVAEELGGDDRAVDFFEDADKILEKARDEVGFAFGFLLDDASGEERGVGNGFDLPPVNTSLPG